MQTQFNRYRYRFLQLEECHTDSDAGSLGMKPTSWLASALRPYQTRFIWDLIPLNVAKMHITFSSMTHALISNTIAA